MVAQVSSGDDVLSKGDRLRVLAAHEVNCVIHWKSPLRSSNRRVLAPGMILVVSRHPSPLMPVFSCVPEHYKETEPVFVSYEEITAEGYDGYSFECRWADLGSIYEVMPALSPA